MSLQEELRAEILRASQELGVRPVDLATAISYETAGTFDPTKKGPTTKWGQHRGLLQWGEPQAQKYLGGDFSIPSQMKGAVSYLRDAGVKPGMGLLDIYSAINAGGVGDKYYGRSDTAAGGAPGTVRDKVEQQMAGHKRKAMGLLGVDGSQSQAAPPLPPPREIRDYPIAGTPEAPESDGILSMLGGASGAAESLGPLLAMMMGQQQQSQTQLAPMAPKPQMPSLSEQLQQFLSSRPT